MPDNTQGPQHAGRHGKQATLNRGERFERASREWLEARGLQILQQNYRCRAGEIDLIARQGNTLVFVEVRARSNPRYASAAASVDVRKQRRLRAAAAHFLRRYYAGAAPPCRFDVLTWQPTAHGERWEPRWIPRAFGSL